MDQKINHAKPLIWSCLSINFRFSSRVSNPTKTSNKAHSFYNTVLGKKLHFTNLLSLSFIVKNILPQHSQEHHLLHKFSSKPVSGCCQIKHLRCTISMHPITAFSQHLESKCLYIPVNLSQKIFVPET